jgi:hypothetical protein
MRVLERLFCNGIWLAWVALLVSRRGARPEERPTMPGSSGEACRRLLPDRAALPGW